MKKLCVLLLALTLVICLVGCGDSPKQEEASDPAKSEQETVSLVGYWESKEIGNAAYNFNEDGTGSYEFAGGALKFTYTDDGKAVTIQYENSSEPNVFAYTIEGTVLSIEDSFGEKVVYNKR